MESTEFSDRSVGGLMSSENQQYRVRAWANVIHSYGTSAVFEKRARSLKWRRNGRDFLGVALPITLGFFATHQAGKYQDIVGYVLAVLALSQLLTVVWSFVAEWDVKYFYARNSRSSNEDMSERWERIGRGEVVDIAAASAEADQRDSLIQAQDRAQDITPKEKCYGMRRALIYRQKSCAMCGITPVSMTRTECECCGKF